MLCGVGGGAELQGLVWRSKRGVVLMKGGNLEDPPFPCVYACVCASANFGEIITKPRLP